MTTSSELQNLLRFLTSDAKLPLAEAIRSVKALQDANLISVESFANTSVEDLTKIFSSAKSAKAVHAAAKRIQKKRSLPENEVSTLAPSKKRSSSTKSELISPDSPAAEESLRLPTSNLKSEDLEGIALHTNRAPLFLAFAIVLLSYTYPHQPLSSRLSLAQAIVSANSRSKAIAIGLESGPSADAEGWGDEQPRIKIMGREIRVLRRWGYEIPDLPDEDSSSSLTTSSTASTFQDDPWASTAATQATAYSVPTRAWTEATVPLWGLDTEKLRDANKGKLAPDAAPTSALPIFTAQAARSYLLRAFGSIGDSTGDTTKKLTIKELAIQKEKNAALLLRVLDLLFSSWKDHLGRDELDRRAWSWYVAVRPDVESGQKGWGEKGKVELKNILSLRRTTE